MVLKKVAEWVVSSVVALAASKVGLWDVKLVAYLVLKKDSMMAETLVVQKDF